MRERLTVLPICLLGSMLWSGAAPAQTAGRAEESLVGSWECVSPELPAEYRHIKHITPTHFTWVTYHRTDMAPLGVAGGTWSREGDTYKERIDFATEGVRQLRGKQFTFTIKLEGDKWFLKSTPGSELAVDEVWKRTGP
jgi:hypothetical protein